MPAFTPPPYAPTPEAKLAVVKIAIDCNWAQILEGAIDSAQEPTLHSTDMTPARVDGGATGDAWLRPSTDKAPRLVLEKSGVRLHAAIRRPITNANINDYVRISVFVSPSTVLIPPNNLYNVANVNVPIDDTHTMFHFIAWTEDAERRRPEGWRRFCGAQVGIDVDRMDKRAHVEQPLPAPAGDAPRRVHASAASPTRTSRWETMGPIADRTHDRLGASDLAIVEFRRMMVEAAGAMRDGGPALGAGGNWSHLRSFRGRRAEDDRLAYARRRIGRCKRRPESST